MKPIMCTISAHIILLIFTGCLPQENAASPRTKHASSLDDQIRKSLIYMEISSFTYDQSRPWSQPDTFLKSGYGILIDSGRILTTSWNVFDASFIKCRAIDKNEFFNAEVEIVDYEANLALLKFDPNLMEPRTLPFADLFPKSKDINILWLTKDGQVQRETGTLDQAQVIQSVTSFSRNLNFIVKKISLSSGSARLLTYKGQPFGIAAWSDNNKQEMGVIPAHIINTFLENAEQTPYRGFGCLGFSYQNLVDPARREYLGLETYPEQGVLISQIYTIGTGRDLLEKGDVLLSVNGEKINPYGQIHDTVYEQLLLDEQITSRTEGEQLSFEIIRDGQVLNLDVPIEKVHADEMLVPYYDYDLAPQYLVTCGYVFRTLTRDYLSIWGENWPGKAPVELMNYFYDKSFMPDAQRNEVVILTHVLPASFNLGYHNLSNIVVKEVNEQAVTSLSDFFEKIKVSQGDFITISFENDNPILVLPAKNLSQIDTMINQGYGIESPLRIRR